MYAFKRFLLCFLALHVTMEADVHDQELELSELAYEWRTYLHHNSHFHPLGESSEQTDIFLANPVGCEEFNDYFYRVSLRVTDPEGLEGYDEVFLFPDCEGLLSASDSNSIDGLILFPNSADEIIIVRFPEGTGQWSTNEIKIHNLVGLVVQERNYIIDPSISSIGVEVSALPQGQHLMHISGDQETISNGLSLRGLKQIS